VRFPRATHLIELAAAVRGETKLRITPDEGFLVQDAPLRCSGMA
jgi:hypothetical protein